MRSTAGATTLPTLYGNNPITAADVVLDLNYKYVATTVLIGLLLAVFIFPDVMAVIVIVTTLAGLALFGLTSPSTERSRRDRPGRS